MAFHEITKLESQLIGQRLHSLELYHVNDTYNCLSTTSLIIDGGISLVFGGRRLTIGWSAEKELFDTIHEPIDSLLDDLAYFVVEEEGEAIFSELKDKKVIDVEIKWNFFQDIDAEFQRIPGVRYVIEEIVLTFEGGLDLQVATIDYNLDSDELSNIRHNLEGELLVTLNNKLEIESFS